jgi:hypothetical protein
LVIELAQLQRAIVHQSAGRPIEFVDPQTQHPAGLPFKNLVFSTHF